MSVKGGRGVPLLSDKKNPFKMAQNQCFWAKNAVFGGKKSVFGNESSVKGGGGGPPFSVKIFPLTVRKNLVRGGPGGGGGGTPPTESFRAWGF